MWLQIYLNFYTNNPHQFIFPYTFYNFLAISHILAKYPAIYRKVGIPSNILIFKNVI